MKILKRKNFEEKGFHELVKVLDRFFSTYIRLSAADDNGYVKCITCGKISRWQDVDNGHYIGRKHLGTRFNEMNCHPQCKWCNGFMEGQHFIYRQKLVERYGEEAVKQMEIFALMGNGETRDSLLMKISDYREKVRLLKVEHGIR